VVTLYYISEYTQAEIAAYLGVSPKTIKRRLSEGRDLLQAGFLATVEDRLHQHKPSRNERLKEQVMNILRIQNAHSDHIAAEFRDAARRPGNPDEVDVRDVAGVRTFYCKSAGFHNRAILTGNETPEQLDQVMQHYVDKGSQCWVELNPANFYPTESPRNSRILPHLLQRDFSIEGLRTIWVRDTSLGPDEQDFSLDVRRVDSFAVWEQSKVDAGESDGEDLDLECGPEFILHTGYQDGQPVAWFMLYCDGEYGYLKLDDYVDEVHRQTFYDQMLRTQIRESFEMGAKRVFTHSAYIDDQWARELQRAGLRIAFNYLLLVREPMPLA